MSEHTLWGKAGRRLGLEWDLITQKTETIAVALSGEREASVL